LFILAIDFWLRLINFLSLHKVFNLISYFLNSYIAVNQTTDKTSKWHKLYVMLIVFIVLAITIAVSLVSTSFVMEAENHARYLGIRNVHAERIAKTVQGMEMNAMNVFDEVQKNLSSPNAVVDALMSKTRLAPDVRGYFAAFEPEFFPEKGRWFEPYVHHTDTTDFVMSQVGSARHDYTKSEWYKRAKNFGKSFWSDPYYYYDGTDISGHYTTFVEPIYDASGKLACVCGADMTFEWLSKALQKIDDATKADSLLNAYHNHSELDFFSVIIAEDGSCIVHPVDKIVAIDDHKVLQDFVDNKCGTIDMNVDGVPSTVFYGPIEHINWHLCVVAPRQNVRQPLFLYGATLGVIALVGLLLVWLVIRRKR
jgi:hypothetical protein